MNSSVIVLQNWQQIGDACNSLIKANAPLHKSPIKNWDLWHIYQSLLPFHKSSRILDIGCSGLNVIRLLLKMGFKEPIGIDLKITIHERLQYLKSLLRHQKFSLYEGDFLKLKGRFDAIIALSVIEHGMESKMFFEKVSNLCLKEGVLLITADYWPEKISTDHIPQDKTLNLPWKIFDKSELIEWIDCAEKYGFEKPDINLIPNVTKPVWQWHGLEYSMVFLSLRKLNEPQK
jgi:SAM-dependent methyltransferase